MRNPITPLVDRIEAQSIPEPNSGCWLWMGAVGGADGSYGVIGVRTTEFDKRGRIKYVNKYAHRVSYECHKGVIPEGFIIDHICENKFCVNPEHLQTVTYSEHNDIHHERRYGDSCKRGHPYDEANTWYEKGGERHCRKCHALTANAWYHRQKDQ